MATYQGERYVRLQLESIVSQLLDGDEIIIVDDGSTDMTCAEISALGDSRIVLLRNEKNQGVLRAFERALSHSAGDIVFLSDQDDIWLPNKVTTVVAAFAADSDLMLVATDAILIDEEGRKIGDSFYARRGRFRAGVVSNLLVGKFHGSTMAFRSRLRHKALPFPQGRQVHHDTWIGCVNALTGGKAKYIAEPLVCYRRHSTNLTGRIRLSNYTRLIVRSQTVWGLMLRWLGQSKARHPFRSR